MKKFFTKLFDDIRVIGIFAFLILMLPILLLIGLFAKDKDVDMDMWDDPYY